MRTGERCVRAGFWGSAALSIALLSPVMHAQYPGVDWQVSTPQAEGMDPAKFASAMASMPSTAIVIRHGKIIGTKGDIARTGYLYSGSKALLATLAAIMMQRGAITFDTPVPGSDQPTPPLANIRHFLTMTSDYNLSPHSPGSHYAYSNSGAIQYGAFLIFSFFPNSTAVQVMRETFLDKIGIQDGLSLIGDISGWGGGGFRMSTRDYARLALLYLRNGNWNGEQLLSPQFMAGLYTPQIPPAATAGGLGDGQVDNQTGVTPRLPGTYSYGWWLPHGTNGYEGSRSNTIAITSTGSFGTSMHVLRDYDMILAGVNTVSTMAGGRIPGRVIDAFANAVVSNTPPPADTTPPSAIITAPAQGATVFGTVMVMANATDNAGIAGVQFLVDGQPLGAEDTAAPYAVSWNTSTAVNGAHTLTALARDAAGNTATASATVTVNNTAPVPCTVAVTPGSLSLPEVGGSGTLNVAAPAGCAWQAVSHAQWIIIAGSARGSGNGTVTLAVTANTGSPRAGIIVVSGQSVTVSQAGTSSVPGGPAPPSVVNAASFQPGIAPGAWIAIFGTNLAATTRTWRDDEIVGGVLPVQLDGIRVTVDGKPAAVYYISPSQLNVQVPVDDRVGPVQVQVTTPRGTIATTAQMQPLAPGLFQFDPENRRYVAAQHAAGYGVVGKPGLYPGSTPAAPGEIVILYGTGFGPTDPPLPAGRVITQPARLVNQPRVTIGGFPARVLWAGLSGAGLYQFNVQLPEGLPDGDAAVVVDVAGRPTQGNVFMTVQR